MGLYDYSRFAELVTDKDTKVVLSLSSGGLRFPFHIEFLKAVEEALRTNGIDPREVIDEIWGSSAGAVVGGAYACGMTVAEMEELSRKINVSLSPAWWELGWSVLRGFRVKGFLDPKRLVEVICKVFEGRKPLIDFYAMVLNMHSNHREAFSTVGCGSSLQALSPSTPSVSGWRCLSSYKPITLIDNLGMAIAASACIQLIFKPVKVNGFDYSDGAVVEPLPGWSIYEKFQCDREKGIEKRGKLLIIASDLGYAGEVRSYEEDAFLMVHSYFELVIHELRKAHQRLLECGGVRLIRLDPKEYPGLGKVDRNMLVRAGWRYRKALSSVSC
jgi:predicted acylesterase/phospholipase RssA